MEDKDLNLELSIETLSGFKSYYEDKAPLVYTYLIDTVKTSLVANELMLYSFYKLYQTRTTRPKGLDLDSWMVLILKQVIISYFYWRNTEGKNVEGHSVLPQEALSLVALEEEQLNLWLKDMNEEVRHRFEKLVQEKADKNVVEQITEINKEEGFVGIAKRVRNWVDKHGK